MILLVTLFIVAAFFLIGKPMSKQNIDLVRRSRWINADFFPRVRKGILGVVGMIFLVGSQNKTVLHSSCFKIKFHPSLYKINSLTKWSWSSRFFKEKSLDTNWTIKFYGQSRSQEPIALFLGEVRPNKVSIIFSLGIL